MGSFCQGNPYLTATQGVVKPDKQKMLWRPVRSPRHHPRIWKKVLHPNVPSMWQTQFGTSKFIAQDFLVSHGTCLFVLTQPGYTASPLGNVTRTARGSAICLAARGFPFASIQGIGGEPT